MPDLLAACASNSADHSEAVLSALGSQGVRGASFCSNSHRFRIPHGHGITLRGPEFADEHLSAVRDLLSRRLEGQTTVIADSWSALDLTGLGFQVLFRDPWLYRQPGPPPTIPRPEGLLIERVTTPEHLAEFEAASCEGFGAPDFSVIGPHGFYAASLVEDPHMIFFTGRVNGRVAAGAMAHVSDGLAGVNTLFTLAGSRGRGYGEAMAWAATLARPDLPAMTTASEMSERIFRRMGYVEIGQRTAWIRRSQG